MKIKTLFSIFILCAFFQTSTFAQGDVISKNGITSGVRMGQSYYNWYSFSARKNFKAGSAELIISPASYRFTVTGLYAIQKPMGGDFERFSYFYGGGGHIALHRSFGPNIGIDLIAGIEYDVPEFPILVSIDVKPVYDLINNDATGLLNTAQGAITVRYTFGG